MPAYRYRAVNAQGYVRRGQILAANENELSHFLSESGLELIEVKPHTPAPLPRWIHQWRDRSPLAQRITLCRQLEDLLRAGLPFSSALQAVIETLPSGMLRGKLEIIARTINHGSSIAAAFAQHPRLFNPVFLAILSAGETGGHLVTTFAQLSKQLRWQERLQKQLSRTLRYPLFLLCLAIGVITFMMTMVVPQVIAFLNSISADLPFVTRLLIIISESFAAWWWIILGGSTLGIAGLLHIRRYSKSLAVRLDRRLLAIPGIGPALHKLAIARFAHSLALLMQGGIDLPSSLRSAAAVLNNRALVEAAYFAEKQLLAGHPFSNATAHVFPPLVTQMLRVGEQSGQLARTLDDVTRYYDDEVQTTIDRFIGSLEPVLTIIVGALLAWVVLAVLGPVYGSLGKLSQLS